MLKEPFVEAFGILGCRLPLSACFRARWPVRAKAHSFLLACKTASIDTRFEERNKRELKAQIGIFNY